jgi:hypothetical protein
MKSAGIGEISKRAMSPPTRNMRCTRPFRLSGDFVWLPRSGPSLAPQSGVKLSW